MRKGKVASCDGSLAPATMVVGRAKAGKLRQRRSGLGAGWRAGQEMARAEVRMVGTKVTRRRYGDENVEISKSKRGKRQ
jgi:hypothetical protein